MIVELYNSCYRFSLVGERENAKKEREKGRLKLLYLSIIHIKKPKCPGNHLQMATITGFKVTTSRLSRQMSKKVRKR